MKTGVLIAGAAESCVGSPFRLHGQTPASGFDCVGLVAWCCRQAGMKPYLPLSYRLRGQDAASIEPFLLASGFMPAEGEEQPGDLTLVRSGPSQVHFMLTTRDAHYVHAHAGLRKVVRTGMLQWQVLTRWHATEHT